VAKGIALRGSAPGDIIVLGKLPTLDMVVALWGCSIGGYVAFPLNTRYPVHELLRLLDDIEPSLCISLEPFGHFSTVLFKDLLTQGRASSGEISELFNQELAATLLMTSGSAGKAKIVQHSHVNHISSANGSNKNIPLNRSSRWMLALPLYHIGGLAVLYRSAMAGGAVIIPAESALILESIRTEKVTHASFVATQFTRSLEAPNASAILAGLEAILLGGSEIPIPVIEKALNHKLPIHLSYGSTEMASQITTTSLGQINPAAINSGALLADRDLIISHEGEILVRGATLAQGYLRGKSLFEIRDAEGWFHTGDVGYMNVQGLLTVTGRMDNQFISGGENIQPEHIESTLCKMDGISQALVLPRYDREFGARPVAYIQLENRNIAAKDIGSFLRKSLPGYMIPVAIFRIPDEFVGRGLKISRHELSEYLSAENKHLQTVE